MSLQASLRTIIKSDLTSGFLVFLVALPLCLGIASASGFPPISGIITAVVGGVVVSLFTGSELTIKGPAAGLIAIALGAIDELGRGDAHLGYKLTLATIVVAGIVQIAFGLVRSGMLSDFFPTSAIHGMLAAIGIIIITKQLYVLLGITPVVNGTIPLLMSLPWCLDSAEMQSTLIGVLSLILLFGLPYVRLHFLRRVPPPVLVVLLMVPLYLLTGGTVEPALSLRTAITNPDFSSILSLTSIKYIVMFAMVGSVESILSVKAIDAMDPRRRMSNMNRDLVAVGIGNSIAGFIGGLPMISEIVRSSANVNNGGQTRWSNFFHGMFLLLFVAIVPGAIGYMPKATLAAMLIYTGYRLASPIEFIKTYRIGIDQLVVFVTTVIVTLLTDLLVGVAAGICTEFIIHVLYGIPRESLFKPILTIRKRDERTYVVDVEHSAIFSNFVGLKRKLRALERDHDVIIDLSNTTLVDPTVQQGLIDLQQVFLSQGRVLSIVGLDNHQSRTNHPTSIRFKR